MQAKKTIVAKVAYFVTFVCTILISTCLAAGSPGVVKSYPLAINFDGYQGTPSGFRYGMPSPLQQVPRGNAFGQQASFVQPPKTVNSVSSYQKRSEITISPRSSVILMQPTVSVPSIINPELRYASAEASVNYQKRTLNGETSGLNNLNYDKDPSENLEQQRTNSSGISEAQRLLLIRQKMIDMQGHTNVSIEDTNWKIAASCLSNQFGTQFIRNKDVKCASSQVVLSISRMQRAGCKSCEPYFHCEGFSNAMRRCKDNYDLQETLNVMRECQGLTNGDIESIEATKMPSQGVDCQKRYLCEKNCKYNPLDGTCPRNNCYRVQADQNARLYRSYMKDRRGRLTSVAYPAGSPIKNRTDRGD